jgi:hypothetical protein
MDWAYRLDGDKNAFIILIGKPLELATCKTKLEKIQVEVQLRKEKMQGLCLLV